MKFTTLILLTSILFQCTGNAPLTLVSSESAVAESVYLTNDHNDNPVLVWTERTGNELNLVFSVSYDNGRSFLGKKSLPLANNVATHAEGMPKVAFAGDGTIIAAYEKQTPSKGNKYAGVICYRASVDGGETWTSERYLHNDSTAGKSRSFFDIERLPDGEIGAAWLDIRLNNDSKGRSVRFARTKGFADFQDELLIDSSACQCCRTDVYSDVSGHVNIAYRGLESGIMGQDIRDMMLAVSGSCGKTFAPPVRISPDHWVIDGCPHTGPSLCSSGGGLYSAWYTEGKGPGLYCSFKRNDEDEFDKPELISYSGRHPQQAVSDNWIMIVWEETCDNKGKPAMGIFYQTSKKSGVVKDALTPPDCNAFSPVVTGVKNGFVVAFLMEAPGGSRVCVTTL